MILWGGLLSFLALLALIVICRMNDFYVLEGKMTAKKYIPCLKKRPNKVADGREVGFSTRDMKLHFDNEITKSRSEV